MPFGTVPVWDDENRETFKVFRTLSPMPFGTVPVWDQVFSRNSVLESSEVSNAFRHGPGLGLSIRLPSRLSLFTSPMPFGTVPVWDAIKKLGTEVTVVVSNAFRHGPGLGLSIRLPSRLSLFTSPMPFGTVPVWDAIKKLGTEVTVVVSNAFRHGPGLGQNNAYIRTAGNIPCLQCLSARSRSGTASVGTASTDQVVMSPMPFGTVPVWD